MPPETPTPNFLLSRVHGVIAECHYADNDCDEGPHSIGVHILSRPIVDPDRAHDSSHKCPYNEHDAYDTQKYSPYEFHWLNPLSLTYL